MEKEMRKNINKFKNFLIEQVDEKTYNRQEVEQLLFEFYKYIDTWDYYDDKPKEFTEDDFKRMKSDIIDFLNEINA